MHNLEWDIKPSRNKKCHTYSNKREAVRRLCQLLMFPVNQITNRLWNSWDITDECHPQLLNKYLKFVLNRFSSKRWKCSHRLSPQNCHPSSFMPLIDEVDVSTVLFRKFPAWIKSWLRKSIFDKRAEVVRKIERHANALMRANCCAINLLWRWKIVFNGNSGNHQSLLKATFSFYDFLCSAVCLWSRKTQIEDLCKLLARVK